MGVRACANSAQFFGVESCHCWFALPSHTNVVEECGRAVTATKRFDVRRTPVRRNPRCLLDAMGDEAAGAGASPVYGTTNCYECAKSEPDGDASLISSGRGVSTPRPNAARR